MRCFICASVIPNQGMDRDIDNNHAATRSTFCKLLSVNSKKDALNQIIFCKNCQELVELVDALADEDNPSDLQLLLQTSLDGYMQQIDRELNNRNSNGECPFQPLRHEILKDLGMVVELKDEDSQDKFQYNIISFDLKQNEGTNSVDTQVEMKLPETVSRLSSGNTTRSETVPPPVNFKTATTIMSTTMSLATNKSGRRSKRKPLNPTKGLASLTTAMGTKFVDKPMTQPPPPQHFKNSNKSPKKKRSSEHSPTRGVEVGIVALSPNNSKMDQPGKYDSKSFSRQSLQGSPRKRAKIDSSNSMEKKEIGLSRTSSTKSMSTKKKGEGVKIALFSKTRKESKESSHSDSRPLSTKKSNENEENVTLYCSYPGCNRKYTDPSRLEAHQKRSHEGQRNIFSCSKCDKSFPARKRLVNHLLRHQETESEHPCSQCNLVFSTKAKLDFHLHHHTNDWSVKCDVCGKGFQSSGRLKQHKKIHESDKPFVCDSCPKTFRTLQYLNIHKKNHPPPSTELNKFPCDKCEAWFSHLSTLREHQRIHTGSLNYSCNTCGEKFAFVSRLKRHLDVKHSNHKQYQCRFCNLSFKQAGNLKSHERRHDDNNKKFKCPHPDCPLTFFNETKLKYHLTVHTGEKPFVCEEPPCGKSFRLKAALRLHTASVHAKVKNYACHVCDRRFSQRQYLNYHLTTHPELDKPRFTCEEPGCGKSFVEPSSLREHSRKHTGDYRFECQHCPSKFVFKSRLVKHLASHAEVKKFQCDLCLKYFTIEAYLKRHMKCVHGIKRKKTVVEEQEEEDGENFDDSNDASSYEEEQSNKNQASEIGEEVEMVMVGSDIKWTDNSGKVIPPSNFLLI